MARSLASRLPACVDVDDLASIGVMGLIDAIRKYDPIKCDNFKNYARIRIKGAMLDELRSLDWVPRSVRQVASRIERQRRMLEQQLGRPAYGDEIAEAMGLTCDRYEDLRNRTLGAGIIAIEDIGTEGGGENRSFLEAIEDTRAITPEQRLEGSQARNVLAEALGTLPARAQLVISLYYREGLNLREVGAVLGVTESRACQIHSRAVKVLYMRLKSKPSVSRVA
jgi:RNA polymerase sigma factor for flagellar operon FliA